MDITHATSWYFPEASGGTEVYIAALATELAELGMSARIVAAREGREADDYWWNETPVHRYPVHPPQRPREVRGEAPHGGFAEFTHHLTENAPSIFHQHAWSYGCGLHHLRFARSIGLPTVLTVHVPSPLCLRGTMMHLGHSACHGIFDQARCADCWLEGRGAGAAVRRLVAAVPMSLSRVACGSGRSRMMSAMGTAWLTRRHGERLREAFELSDRVVAVCDWLFAALRDNGLADDKLVLSRQGVSGIAPSPPRAPPAPRRQPTRFGYLGRADPVKGLHLLIEAFSGLPASLDVEMHVHALVSSEDEGRYLARLMERASADQRIKFLGPLPRDAVADALTRMDALLVPSQWLETGPQVVLEAQATGIAVIGSDLGGISELLRNDPAARLVAHDDLSGWARAIEDFATERRSDAAAEIAPRAVRAMGDVAAEMHSLYQQLA